MPTNKENKKIAQAVAQAVLGVLSKDEDIDTGDRVENKQHKPRKKRADQKRHVPFVNRPFESEIHGTVNFTQFCCVLLVTWCYRVLLSCYLRPK